MPICFACNSFSLGSKFLLVLHRLTHIFSPLGGVVLMHSGSELLLLLFVIFILHSGLRDPQGLGPHSQYLPLVPDT